MQRPNYSLQNKVQQSSEGYTQPFITITHQLVKTGTIFSSVSKHTLIFLCLQLEREAESSQN